MQIINYYVVNIQKLSIKFGNLSVVQKGKLHNNYSELETSNYMKNSDIICTCAYAQNIGL